MHLTYCKFRYGGGWQVRSGKPGPGQTKFFNDRKHGGTEAARQAAEAFIESVRPLAPPPAPRPAAPQNETQVPGIRVRLRQHRGQGPVYRCLCVSFTDKTGHQHCTSISLESHGTTDAVERALDLRGLRGPARTEARRAVLQTCQNGNHR